MAAEDADTATFEDIDWDAQGISTLGVSRAGLAELLSYLGLIAAFVYDYTWNTGPLVFRWDVLSVEWLFIGTLIAIVFHAVIPLSQKPRLRAFYWRRFKKNQVAVVALGWLAVMFVVGVLGPLLIDPPTTQFTNQSVPPVGMSTTVGGVVKTGTWQYPLGTSAKGQGILTLVVYGMRVSMEVGLIATIFSVIIGSAVGAVAAFATSVGRGRIDELLMRYVDVQSVFPDFMLLLLLTYLFGSELWMIILLFGFFSWEDRSDRARGGVAARLRGVHHGRRSLGCEHALHRAPTSHSELGEQHHHQRDGRDSGVHSRRGVTGVSRVQRSDHVLVGADHRHRAGEPRQRVVDRDDPRRVPVPDGAVVLLRRGVVA